ncbi:MAG: hypothetical protein HWN69_07050 [Desulfobacterales bacterium]|nr:hypothetical protein [Desulfobacterales bacterium]
MDYKDKEKDFNEAFNNAYDLWYPWMDEAHRDFKYVLKHPWTEADLAYFKEQNREVLNFNITCRIVKLITGYERRNRLVLKIGPSETSDSTVADQLNGIVMPLMENNHGYEILSDAFEMGALITGMNLVEPYIDRWGNIQFSRKPYNKFLLDPHFTRRDLKDCSYLIIHEEGMLTEDVKSLIPGKDKMIEEYAKSEGPTSGFLPFSAYRGRGRDEGKRCNYHEFWERTNKKVKVLALRRTGQKFIWKQSEEKLEEIINRYPLDLVSWEDYIETVEFSAYVNGRCVHKGPDPNGIDEYPQVLISGFWYPEFDDYSVKLQGEVRRTRDPQKEVSKRISKILDIIDSQVSVGYEAEEGALVDPADIHASGQGKGIWFKEGALSENRARQRQMADIPQGLFQLNRDLQALINDIACVNDSMFGTEEINAQMSGYLMKLRQGAGLVALQDLFDNLRFSKKQLGFKLIKLIQKNYPPSKVFRILNEQPVPNFYTEDLSTYDCIPQEGVLTETQQQMFYTELVWAKGQGAPLSWRFIFENSPMQFKRKILAEIDQTEKRQAAMEQEKQKEKALLDKMRQAKIAADFGRAEERKANVEEHHADAGLARVKMAKEIEDMDWNRLFGLMDRLTALETAGRKESMTRR